MSTYIHCHIGQLPPPYLLDSCESIIKVDGDARIILITDQEIEIDGIEVFQVNDIRTEQTHNVMNMELFSSESNPLWRTSIFRVFLVRDIMYYLNLSNCYHFDSDVLLFQSPDIFESVLDDFAGLYITYHNEYEVVFGFSRFGTVSKINEICDILFEVVFDNNKQIEYAEGGMPNEMRIVNGIMKRRPDLIKPLGILPSLSPIVFDPSSYGQYFGGTHQGHPPGFAHETHIIGREIQNGNVFPIMIDKKPYVRYKEEMFPIVNLHIHSKNTRNFIL